MRFWPILALVWFALPSMAADNPLNFSKHPIGQTPTGFRVTDGEASEWVVTETKTPSELDPSKIVKRHCLRHKGGNIDSDRYPTLILKSHEYTDFTLKTSFRIDGGNGTKAAGMLFRAQKDDSYILFAIIPAKKRMYLKYCEKGVPVGGPESDIKLPEDGWYRLELTCQNDQISGRLNGGTFPVIPLKDMPRGKIGFWARGDTDCLFALSTIKVPLSLAQSAVNEITRSNEHLQRMELAAIRPGKKTLEIAAATDVKQVGQPAHTNCRATIENGAVVYSERRDIIEVIMPIKNVDGEIMAAARMFLKPGKLTTKTRHRARASAVAIELGKKIQTHAKLFR